jgi:hypothetical protein
MQAAKGKVPVKTKSLQVEHKEHTLKDKETEESY